MIPSTQCLDRNEIRNSWIQMKPSSVSRRGRRQFGRGRRRLEGLRLFFQTIPASPKLTCTTSRYASAQIMCSRLGDIQSIK